MMMMMISAGVIQTTAVIIPDSDCTLYTTQNRR